MKCAQRESDEKRGLKGMQLEGLSIWILQASGCREVILSRFFFSLYFPLIRALLIVQSAAPLLLESNDFPIVILSLFRLPTVGGRLLSRSHFAHCLPPSSSLEYFCD